jgi:hypothetical protein
MLKQDLIAAALAGALALAPATLVAQNTVTNASTAPEAKPAKDLQSPAGPAEDKWRFSLVPLAWLPGIDGNVTVRGRTADVNVNFDQIFQHLDGAFMAYLEARKDKFGFYAQPTYVKLEGDGNAGPLQGSVTLKMWVVEAGGFYQLGKWGEEKPLELSVFAGMRYWSLDADVNINGTRGDLINLSGSTTLDLYDPLIGLKAQRYLTEKLSLVLRGDIGGFGASNSSSDFSWQALGLVGYDFSKHFAVFAGYRALALRKETGSGSGKHGVDLIFNGALLGFDFTF